MIDLTLTALKKSSWIRAAVTTAVLSLALGGCDDDPKLSRPDGGDGGTDAQATDAQATDATADRAVDSPAPTDGDPISPVGDGGVIDVDNDFSGD